MILSRTPFRVSFVGGGSDLPAFYEQSPGAVLSTSINRYMYIQSHAFFEESSWRVKYAQTETVQSLPDLQHPIFRTVFQKWAIDKGIEVSSIADVPSGTGLGSSSSFTVGLLHNMLIHKGLNSIITKDFLAQQACEVELIDLKEPIGKQDQYAAAHGGLNIFRFLGDGQVITEPLGLSADALTDLSSHLVMYYTGDQRSASAILSEQSAKTATEADKKNALHTMVSLVDPLADALRAENWTEMGRFLHENWLLKQSLANGISTAFIQQLYTTALRNGATGGKLLGAGGGGFLLFFCPPSEQDRLDKALHAVRKFPFSFESEGSKVLYAD